MLKDRDRPEWKKRTIIHILKETWWNQSRSNLIIFCRLNLERFPSNHTFLKLHLSFQQRLAHLPSSWLVCQATSFSRHHAEQRQTCGINLQPCGKHYGVYLITETTQQHKKSHLIISKRCFLKRVEIFQPLGEETRFTYI